VYEQFLIVQECSNHRGKTDRYQMPKPLLHRESSCMWLLSSLTHRYSLLFPHYNFSFPF
jgi:hypothetical protein